MCGVTSFANVWKRNQWCNDIYMHFYSILLSDLALWLKNMATFAG